MDLRDQLKNLFPEQEQHYFQMPDEAKENFKQNFNFKLQ